MKNFESSFFESLVESSAISKADVTALKRAIKRQNPHFVDDVLARNFKGSNEDRHEALAKRYAKSFARELSQSNTGKFKFSDRLLKTDLKHNLVIEPELTLSLQPQPVAVESMAQHKEKSEPVHKPTPPKLAPLPPLARPKKQKDDFEF